MEVDWGLERVFTFLFIIIFLLFFKYLTFRYFRKLSEQNQLNWDSSNNPEIVHVHASSNTHHLVDLSAPPPQFESALKYPTPQNIAYIEIDPPSYEDIIKSSRINLSQLNENEIDTTTTDATTDTTTTNSKTSITQNHTSISVETKNIENPQENKLS